MSTRLLLSALLACGTFACSSDHHDDENPAFADVAFVGGTTDEALEQLLDAARKDVPSEYVTFLSPAASATLSKDTPTNFQFQGASAKLPSPSLNRHTMPMFRQRSALEELEALLTPIGVAHAHGTPFNGTAYLLVFDDAAKSTRLRVFTSQTSYTPDASAWAGLAAGEQPITLSVTSATFESNAVLSDGGPFVGGTLSFSVR
ncbi:MAG: hypothetical protein ACOY0T_31410 [Myxococcota bacterium]